MPYATFNRFELRLTRAEVDSVPRQGRADDAVAALRREPRIIKELSKIDAEALRDELQGYGAWDDAELANHDDNLDRILWIAALDIAEETRT